MLLDDGRVLLVPAATLHVAMFDPLSRAVEEIELPDIPLDESHDYAGGVLLPSGEVLLPPPFLPFPIRVPLPYPSTSTVLAAISSSHHLMRWPMAPMAARARLASPSARPLFPK